MDEYDIVLRLRTQLGGPDRDRERAAALAIERLRGENWKLRQVIAGWITGVAATGLHRSCTCPFCSALTDFGNALNKDAKAADVKRPSLKEQNNEQRS